MTYEESISADIQAAAVSAGRNLYRLTKAQEYLKKWGLADQDDIGAWLYINHYGDEFELAFQPNSQEELQRLKSALNGSIGEFRKEFDGLTNKIILIGRYKEAVVKLELPTPDTCKVEVVEEKVEHPAVPARTETIKRYKLVGDCEPLMKPIKESAHETLTEDTGSSGSSATVVEHSSPEKG